MTDLRARIRSLCASVQANCQRVLLKRQSEALLSFNYDLSAICFAIHPGIHIEILNDMQDAQPIEYNHRDDGRLVSWCVLLSEDVGRNDSGDTTGSYQDSAGHRTFRLTDNVVVHICEDSRNIAVAASDTEKAPSISCFWAGGSEANEAESD